MEVVGNLNVFFTLYPFIRLVGRSGVNCLFPTFFYNNVPAIKEVIFVGPQ